MVTFDGDEILNASIGGLILGIATSFNLACSGQITGMSGCLNNVLRYNKKTFSSRLTLILAMIVTSGIFYYIDASKEETSKKFFSTPKTFQDSVSTIGYIIAGFCVGFGTKLGNGCTSGHGLCGLPRFSIRSIVGVGCFLSLGILTATLKYYLFDPPTHVMGQIYENQFDATNTIVTSIIIGISAATIALLAFKFREYLNEQMIFGLTGVLFAVGLIVAGMVKQEIVLAFLTINSNWNPALMFVLGCGVGLNLITFHFIQKMDKPYFGEKLCIPNNKTIDWQLIVGELIFGIGWGIAGVCPGPLFCNLPLFFTQLVLLFLPSLIFGSFCVDFLQKQLEKKSQSSDNYNQIQSKQ